MKTALVLFVVGVLGMTLACSNSPSIQPGSPAFFWAVAQESYRTGDVTKANNTLCELAHAENPFQARARVWHLVLSAGLSRGYSELADAYDAGATMNLTSPVRFHNAASNLRSLAASAALEFTQTLHETVKLSQDANIALSFPFPAGSAAEPDGLRKISDGIWIPDDQRDALQAAMLQRGVLQAVADVMGSAGDTAKAKTAFQSPVVQVSRPAFLFRAAQLLYQESELYGPQRMDRPNRRALLCQEALIALQSIPETDDTKNLAAKIQATVKAISGS